MNNKVVCCVICVVVIILLVSIIFSLSNNKEKFNDGASQAYLNSGANGANGANGAAINSIVSKIDGTMLNVRVTEPQTTNADKTIEILVDNNGNKLCMDDTNRNVSKCSDVGKLWILKHIDSIGTMGTVLSSNSHSVQYSTMNNFPFYMVLTSDNKFALHYNHGRFSVVPVGNYDSQKWDVSDYTIPEKQLFERDIYDGPLDKIQYSRGSDPNNRIKINLNVNDEKLKELLHLDSEMTSGASDSSKCDRYVSKESLENVCAGCNV